MTTNEELKELLVGLHAKADKNELLLLKVNKKSKKNTKDIKKLKDEKTELKSEVNFLKKEIRMLKISARNKNIIMYNIEDKKEINSGLFDYVSKIVKDMDIDESCVESVRRLGFHFGARPVVLTVNSLRNKKRFFEKAEEFKFKHNITMAFDSPKEDRIAYNKLKGIRDELIKTGIEATLSKGKIVVENNFYSASQALQLLKKKERDEIEMDTGNEDGKESESSSSESEEDSDTSVMSHTTTASKKRAASSSPGDEVKATSKKEKKDKSKPVLRESKLGGAQSHTKK